MNHDSAIFVAGQDSLMGSALVRELQRQGYTNLVGVLKDEPNLTDADEMEAFFRHGQPEYVIVAGGKTGGIEANQKYPADLIRDNLLVDCNVIHGAHCHGVRKLLYLASSCSYPKHCPQPMRVESLLTGPLEPTNEAYAVAKIAGIKMCQAYRSQHAANFITGIPANPFGPGDDFTPEDSHVIAALILKIHEAKERGDNAVPIWGTGAPRREFISADDVASACIFVMQEYEGSQPINLGGGEDLSILEAATVIKEVIGYQGEFTFDTSKPDGMPVKLMDSSELLAMGWKPSSNFRNAIQITYRWFLEHLAGTAASGGTGVATR